MFAKQRYTAVETDHGISFANLQESNAAVCDPAVDGTSFSGSAFCLQDPLSAACVAPGPQPDPASYDEEFDYASGGAFLWVSSEVCTGRPLPTNDSNIWSQCSAATGGHHGMTVTVTRAVGTPDLAWTWGVDGDNDGSVTALNPADTSSGVMICGGTCTATATATGYSGITDRRSHTAQTDLLPARYEEKGYFVFVSNSAGVVWAGPAGKPQCDDGVDNEGTPDGLIDFSPWIALGAEADVPDCTSYWDNDESGNGNGSPVPADATWLANHTPASLTDAYVSVVGHISA
ncbi:MAG: hypothetical protein HY556_10520 [Euryarchaeota archaeon]|nr:hypothetical protein [Euryarchaeota archaeon]